MTYEPARYWSQRLADDFSLRGTGHISYSEPYNQWLYRAKHRALWRALGHRTGTVRALDVGSGVGWVVDQLLAWGATVEGCDIAEVAVDGLRSRFPGMTFYRHAVGSEPLPCPAETYDLITMLDVAYHLTDDDRWEAAVDDLARALRRGGRLVVTDRFGATDAVPAPHVRFRAKPRWLDSTAASGLRLVAIGPLFRWLSRDEQATGFARLPDRLRGAIEYGLELTAPRPAHMRWAVFAK